MFKRYPHPLLQRQAAAVVQEKIKNEQPVEEVKAETVPPDFQAAGLYPPPRLAQAYVIWQKYGPTFSPAEALEKGTIFPELYSPYPY
ncbi:MAG: spore coat associated protein CotJA [Firmicutes bacterium]|nr:spore coat associated protein CotJA [Bacillota bacterium]